MKEEITAQELLSEVVQTFLSTSIQYQRGMQVLDWSEVIKSNV